MKIKKTFPGSVCVIGVFLFIYSCGNSEKTDEQQAEETALTGKLADSNITRIHSLPAPMQVASAIKRSNADFVDGLLIPVTCGASSAFEKTVSLGMYAVDLGYANVYDQHQTSIVYFSNSLKLADEMKIMGPMDPEVINRFKENIDNPDSVCHYTLSSFRKIHNNLLSNNRQQEAYLILAGSFIEGVYLSSGVRKKADNKDVVHLIGEQKIFLGNLLQLLSNYENDSNVQKLDQQLSGLKDIYDKIDIQYKAGANPDEKEILPISVPSDILDQISTQISLIRQSIIHIS